MQLDVAELIAGDEISGTRRAFEVAVGDLPFGLDRFAGIGTAPVLHPVREIAAIEEHDSIRRRSAQNLSRRDRIGMRAVGVVDVPGLAGQNAGIGIAGSGLFLLGQEQRGQAEPGGGKQAKGVAGYHGDALSIMQTTACRRA